MANKLAVFLSYASEDIATAERIAAALRAAGIEVWFDQNELVGGDAWDHKIRTQIQECALFLPIISVNTQAREEGYFRLEWRMADQRTQLMGRRRTFLLPICIDHTTEKEADVPESFLAVQWIRLSHGNPDATLVAHVQNLLNQGGAALPETVAAAARSPHPIDQHSVAVLAFANLSNDADNEYFSDGISEELINVLARIPGLKVSARTSAFHFKGTSTPIPEIAHRLGVAYVVEGSVRKAGNRVRITAQLIKASDGFHAWSETFTRDLTDIFAVQDEIAGLVARNLSLHLTPRSQAARKINPEAYRLFLEGRTIFYREVSADYPLAIQCYEQSLELDPEAALTWAWLSMAHALNTTSGQDVQPEGKRLTREAAERALALDPKLAQAHLALAMYQLIFGWDWPEARARFDSALELAPGDAEVISMDAHLQGMLGNLSNAVASATRAVELDPLNFFTNYAIARNLLLAGRFSEAEQQAQRAIALNPVGLRLRMFFTSALLMQGRVDEAATAAEAVPAGWGQHLMLACVRHAQGRRTDSENQLQQLRDNYAETAPYQIAQVYAFRGEKEEAFQWLQTSVERQDSGVAQSKTDPLMRTLYDDPRWEAHLRKLGLADDQLA